MTNKTLEMTRGTETSIIPNVTRLNSEDNRSRTKDEQGKTEIWRSEHHEDNITGKYVKQKQRRRTDTHGILKLNTRN